jgi:wyosine [tRNA(Phe)-imidazoG37] synthetase (radical SAM superfamily)
MDYKHIFGPVPSRRLGISLGIDLIPFKTCTLNCIYCECGATTNITSQRKEFIPTNEILAELDDYLKNKPKLDYITFSGSGEPTLHTGIGKIINHIKKKHPEYSTALLTNGTLLWDKNVRKEIKNIDLLLPSLDAVSSDVFNKINRPCGKLDNDKIIKGLIEFSKKFKGKIWLEVFIVPGINDKPEELNKFKAVLQKINPDIIQLNSMDRPGTEDWVKKSDHETMRKIKDFFYPLNTEIIAKYKNKSKTDIKTSDIQDIILSTIKRRPCTLEDIIEITGLHRHEIAKNIEQLLVNNKIDSIKKERGIFYKLNT